MDGRSLIRYLRLRWTVPLAVISAVLFSGPASAAAAGGDAWLHDQLATPRDLPGFGVAGDYPVPLDDLFTVTGPFSATIRDNTVRAAHARSLDAFDGTKEVQIRLVEMVNHSFASGYRNPGNAVAAQPALIAPAAKVVRHEGTPDSVVLYTVFARGRVKAELVATVRGPADTPGTLRAAVELIRRVSDAQYRALADSADLTARTMISLARERYALVAGLVTTVLLLLGGRAASAFVVDRSTRDRLLLLLRRSPVPPRHPAGQVIDVSTDVRRRLRRYRIASAVRIAVFLAVLLVTFAASLLEQLALLCGLAFVWSLFELAVARWRRRAGLRAAYGVGALAATVVGTTLTLVIWGVAAFVVFVPLMLRLAAPKILTADQLARVITLLTAVALLLLGLSDVVHRLSRRFALRSASKIVERDERQEILFLRSFVDDPLRVRAHRTGRQGLIERLTLRSFDRFEEVVAWTFWQFGPAVALSEPGTRLPPVGAARLTVGNADWVALVEAKIRTSQMIVMTTGRTEAVVFEIERIRAAGALGKTIFAFPPVAERELLRRLEVVSRALDLEPGVLVPVYPGGRFLLLLRFGDEGTPVITVGRRRDDIGYQVAMEAAAEAICAGPRARVYGPSFAARVVTSAPMPAGLPKSPGPKAVRKRRRRAWFAVLPWVGSLALSCAGGILAPPSAPAVPIPGRVLVAADADADGLTAGGPGEVWYLDRVARTLVSLHLDGGRHTEFTFAAVPLKMRTNGDLTFVTTRDPSGVVALKRDAGRYSPLWTAQLDAVPVGLATAGGHVAVTQPAADTVVLLNAATGVREKSASPGRGPWSIAAEADRFLVGNLTDETVSELSTGSLATMSATPTVGPANLGLVGSDVTIVSVEDSSLTTRRGGRTIWRTEVALPSGELAVSDTVVVVPTYGKAPALAVYDRATGARLASHRLPSEAVSVALVGTDIVCALPAEHKIIAVPLG